MLMRLRTCVFVFSFNRFIFSMFILYLELYYGKRGSLLERSGSEGGRSPCVDGKDIY